jgi:ubiquinol-cytochrome c reductase cytochrome c1 subunit
MSTNGDPDIMKNIITALALCGMLLAAGVLTALPAKAQDNVQLDHFPDQTDDLASLQRGARLFTNYCLNCHSANLMRYSRLGDIGLTDQEIAGNLLFTGGKVGDTMGVAMRPTDAKEWFGVAPPDLSVEVRARGADWIYTYLRSFYRDDSRPTGWNNVVYQNVSMPHVLWQLQGQRSVKFEVETSESGEKTEKLAGFTQITPGTMAPNDYDSAVADLVSYMSWMAEPTQKTRKQLGAWVLLFLAVMVLFTWRLNAAYWKGIK